MNALYEPIRPYVGSNPVCFCVTCLAAEAAGMLADDRAAWTGTKGGNR